MCQFWRFLQRCKIAATPPLCSAGSLGRRRTGSWVTRLGRARHSSIQRRLADRDSSRGSGHVHRWTMSIALSTICDLLKQQNVLTVQPHNFHSLCSHAECPGLSVAVDSCRGGPQRGAGGSCCDLGISLIIVALAHLYYEILEAYCHW